MNNDSSPDMIGQSPAFLDALSHASAIAMVDRPALITGERGTGKELLANRLHYLSQRWEAPFIKVNCAALSDDLLESELFGHEAGAFTGASKRHQGRFERAEGGTLFLDEIATISVRTQEKLLRVIEYGEYERLGGEQTRKANVRIVAAANIDLRRAAQQQKFRADLLDRLSFEVIHAPPLRARRTDIPLLAAHFAATFISELSTYMTAPAFIGFTPEAAKTLLSHTWHGNIRELKNTVERSIYRWINSNSPAPVSQIILDPFEGYFDHHFEGETSTINAKNTIPQLAEQTNFDPISNPNIISKKSFNLKDQVEEFEKELTIKALEANDWHQKRAAKFTQLSYDQLRGLVRKYNLKAPSQKSQHQNNA